MLDPKETDCFDLSNLVLDMPDDEPESLIPLTERFEWARQRLRGMLDDLNSENKRIWCSRQDIHNLILESIEQDTDPKLSVDGTPFYLFLLAPEIARARVAVPCFPFKVDQIKAALDSLQEIWGCGDDDQEDDFFMVDTALTMLHVQVGRLTLLTLTDPGADEMEEKAIELDKKWGAKALEENPELLEAYEPLVRLWARLCFAHPACSCKQCTAVRGQRAR